MHVQCLITLVIVMIMTLTATLLTSSSLLPSPSSQQQYYQIQHTDFQGEDYGFWNPTPHHSGGGDGAPIPHAQAAC